MLARDNERTREIEKLGPSTQKVSKLNAVDQKLMRQATTIVIDTIREKLGALDEAKAAENEDSEAAPGEKDLAAEACPEDSAADKDRSKAAVTEVISDISGEQMLKLCCMLQQKRGSRLMEMEESVGITAVGHREIQLLAKIAEAVMNHQSNDTKMKWKDDAHELPPREIEKLSPLAQKFSKLDFIDRNLIRQATAMMIDMILEKFAELKTEQELQENGD